MIIQNNTKIAIKEGFFFGLGTIEATFHGISLMFFVILQNVA